MLARTPFVRRRKVAAFTLVEVMASSMVLVLVLVGSIGVIQTGFKALDNSRATTLASQVIQSEMERVRLLSWSAVNALPASQDINLGTLFPTGSVNVNLADRITATRTVADVTGRVGEVREITVLVTWRGIDGITHQRASSTHYGKDGLYAYYYTRAR
jgi:type II secretory pathway pseudopilin PulG